MSSGAADTGAGSVPGLQCVDVWLRYATGLPLILRGVSLTVRPAEVLAVVGHNGAGKSTVVKALAGVVAPERGEIHLDGERIDHQSVRAVMDSGVSCVWQELSVVPTMSVTSNLLMGMHDRSRLVRRPWLARRAVRELVERCGIGDIELRATVGSLPFVDRQRVEIAKALASHSRYLLLDEPTAGQRGAAREGLFELIRATARDGVGVLLVNHHLDEVIALADRAVVLRDGAVAGEVKGTEMNPARIAELMTGSGAASMIGPALPPSLEPGSGETVARSGRTVSVKGGRHAAQRVRLRCGELRPASLSPIDLELMGGRVYGFYGLEGAGQADLLKVLAGDARPDGGWIEVDGRRVRFHQPADAVRQGVFYLSGDRAAMICPTMTGTDNLLMSGMAASPMWRLAPGRRERERIAAELIDELQVRGDWSDLIPGLSGGNQQKLIVGRLLRCRHSVVLLEGPTLGVDITARVYILAMIRRLARDHDSTVCLASEDEDEVIDACDEVFVLAGGRVVERLEVDQSLTKEQLRATAVAASPVVTQEREEPR